MEKTLNALLSDNAVSSWKIAGEGDNTVVVLRLKPASTAETTTMADPALNRTSQVQYYRKKAPAQVRRDQERARQQKKRHQTDQQECDSECHVIPPSFDDEAEQIDLEDQHSAATQDDDTPSVFVLPPTCAFSSTTANVTVTETCDGSEYQELESSVGGFSTAVVKEYVSTLTDIAVQRRLRDKTRNKVFRKVVEHESEKGSVVFCESDDIVLEYSNDLNAPPKWRYWFVKQEERSMLHEERARMADLQRGKRLHARQRSETRARAERDLEVLHGLLLFYLG